MKQMHYAGLLVPVLIAFLSCGGFGQQKKQLSCNEFEQGISQANSQLLDVRTAEEYRTGHIAHSLQANWNNKVEFQNRAQYLDKTKPLYVYCATGGRSKAAAAWFRSNGFGDVYELSGGFIKWKAENKPAEGTADIQPMTWDDYIAAIGNNGVTLVDIGAAWCPPCRKMEPVLQQLQTDWAGRFKLVRIDAGVHTALLKQVQVAEFPTFILYKNGREVWRQQGLTDLAELKQQINNE